MVPALTRTTPPFIDEVLVFREHGSEGLLVRMLAGDLALRGLVVLVERYVVENDPLVL